MAQLASQQQPQSASGGNNTNNNSNSFFDNIISKIQQAVRVDEDKIVLFDQQCPPSGQYPSPASIITASDLRRVISHDISQQAVICPPRQDLQRVLDEIFAELTAAATQLDSVLQMERGTVARARGLEASAALLNRQLEKETGALDQLVKNNLRCEIVPPVAATVSSSQSESAKLDASATATDTTEKKEQATAAGARKENSRRPTVALYKKWNQMSIANDGAAATTAATAAAMKLAAEKEEWEKMIAELEK